MKKLFAPAQSTPTSIGLLLVRLAFGIAMMLHGWPKIQDPFHWMDKMGPGMPGPLQALAAISEAGGGLAIALGLLTPFAALGLFATMATAVFVLITKMHAPFVGASPKDSSYELALVYLTLSALFLLAGPGKFSFDALLFKGSGGKIKAGR